MSQRLTKLNKTFPTFRLGVQSFCKNKRRKLFFEVSKMPLRHGGVSSGGFVLIQNRQISRLLSKIFSVLIQRSHWKIFTRAKSMEAVVGIGSVLKREY